MMMYNYNVIFHLLVSSDSILLSADLASRLDFMALIGVSLILVSIGVLLWTLIIIIILNHYLPKLINGFHDLIGMVALVG